MNFFNVKRGQEKEKEGWEEKEGGPGGGGRVDWLAVTKCIQSPKEVITSKNTQKKLDLQKWEWVVGILGQSKPRHGWWDNPMKNAFF